MSLQANEPIKGFFGDYRFLSNFWWCEVEYDFVKYPSTEHAYQAAKYLDLAKRDEIRQAKGFGDAKRLARAPGIREDWDEYRIKVMYDLLKQKFAKEEFKYLLLGTGDAYLEETNTWGDRFWGVDGTGKNMLGIMLMNIRDKLEPFDFTKIFVFGSNLGGRHGKGSALFAKMYCGAQYGVGEGLQGNSYAIPTKGYGNPLPIRSLEEIEKSVKTFLNFAKENHGMQFYVTPIGCGLAGFSPSEIGPMFKRAPSNVELPKEFLPYV